MSTAQQQLNKLARRATLDSHNCDSELEPTESTSDSIILPELIGHSELLTQQRMYCVSSWLPSSCAFRVDAVCPPGHTHFLSCIYEILLDYVLKVYRLKLLKQICSSLFS